MGAVDLKSKKEGILYHYTKAASLMNILESKKLWLTRADFVNDNSEILLAKKLIEEACETIDKEIANAILFHLECRIKSFGEFYILSLSENDNSYALWSNYAGFNGYNLGFDVALLNLNFYKMNPYIYTHGKVIYNKQVQESIIKNEINSLVNNWSGTFIKDNEEANITATTLFHYIPFFKNEFFQNEQEYRYVFHLHDEDSDRVEFRVHNDIFIPYVEVMFEPSVNNYFPGITIKSITIGPKHDIQLSKRGIEEYLRCKTYKAPDIILSKLPIR